MTVHS